MAVLDHLTQGRFIAGFARGYQDRWSNILGQRSHVTGTPMDGSAVDTHNRDVFEEMYQIIKIGVDTRRSIRFQGKYYQIPKPVLKRGSDAGQSGRPGPRSTARTTKWTRIGYVQRICVVPKPYTQPHPPIWQPFSVSEKTIRWCAKEGIMPWILISHPPSFRQLCEAYREEANKAGRKITLGDNIGAHRSVHLGKTRDEAYAIGETAAGTGWPDYFAPFGFFEAFRFPGETTPVPQTYDRMIEAKFEMIGTVDDIKRELEAMLENSGLEWFGWYFDQGVMSWDEQRQANGAVLEGGRGIQRSGRQPQAWRQNRRPSEGRLRTELLRQQDGRRQGNREHRRCLLVPPGGAKPGCEFVMFDVILSSLISHLVVGLAEGMIFVLLALGLSLIFGLLGIVNFARRKPFRSWSVFRLFRIRPDRQLLASIARWTGNGRRSRSPDREGIGPAALRPEIRVNSLLITFGCSLVIVDLVRLIWGKRGVEFDPPLGFQGALDLGVTLFPMYWLVVIGGTLLVLAGLTWFLVGTDLGLIIRAERANR